MQHETTKLSRLGSAIIHETRSDLEKAPGKFVSASFGRYN